MNTINKINTELLKRITDRFGLPLHVIFLEKLKSNTDSFLKVIKSCYPKTKIIFAVKSNPCRGAVRAVSRLGLGVDTVSEYELQAALEENVSPSQIVCNGNAKSERYLEMSLKADVLVAVDNVDELGLLDSIAKRKNRKARILIRFAGMPLEGLTSADQSTASTWTKFGFPIEDAEKIYKSIHSYKYISFEGISAHIGTQICDESGYDRLMDYIISLAETALQCKLNVNYVDIGGGFPVSYMTQSDWIDFRARLRDQLSGRLPTSDWVTWDNLPMGYSYLNGRKPQETDAWVGKAYWSKYPDSVMLEHILTRIVNNNKTVSDRLSELGSPTLIIEPGRALIGTSGITLARVYGVKEVMNNPVVILDMGIVNHGHSLITPDIHPFEALPLRSDDKTVEVFIAGRLCFSGDMISKVKVKLNRMPKRDELMIIHHTGSYCADHFASNSCGFPRPAKIAMIEDGSIEIWRKGEVFEDVFY